jgi:hypothetical protein
MPNVPFFVLNFMRKRKQLIYKRPMQGVVFCLQVKTLDLFPMLLLPLFIIIILSG